MEDSGPMGPAAEQVDSQERWKPLEIRAHSFAISPSGRSPLAGRLTAATAERIHDELECTLVALDGEGGQTLLASFDLLYVGDDLRRTVVAAFAPFGPADRVLTAATHTHNAPATDPSKPLLGAVDPSYVERLHEQVRRGVRDLMEQPARRCEVLSAQTVLAHSINRRRLRRRLVGPERKPARSVGMGPNPAGPVDELATVAEFRSGSEPAALLWNYACHPTGFPDPSAVSADFPGEVRRLLRRQYGNPRLPILFLQGFSGDTRPPFRRKMRTPFDAAIGLCYGPSFGPPSMPEYRRWTESLGREIAAALDRTTPSGDGRISTRRAEVSRSRFVADGRPQPPPVSFHHFSLGDLVILGGSGEFMSGLAPRVRALQPGKTVLPTGCIDDVLGYVPSARMLAEGGYEGGGFARWFGITSIDPDIESRALEGFASAAGVRDA